MTVIGIVGHGADKFNSITETTAKKHIRNILLTAHYLYSAKLSSGRSPVGGIDVWAEEEALKLDDYLDEDDKIYNPDLIFNPKVHQWNPQGYGYRARNIDIAKHSDTLICIVVDEYPDNYQGMVFDTCYHHIKKVPVLDHVKSGGCWTAKQAYQFGKDVMNIIIHTDGSITVCEW